MSETALPKDRFGADTYLTALENLIDRYTEEEEPIHYKKAAININETTCSSCLRFFSDIDLIKAEKAGVYIPTKELINFHKKVGSTKELAKSDLDALLSNYGIYHEAKFLAEREAYELEELATEIAGQLGVDKEDISKVERAIEIFEKFDLLAINEEGKVSVVTLGEEQKKANKRTNEKFVEQKELSTDSSPEFPTTATEIPPTRGDQEKLLAVIEVLSEGGKRPTDEITEEVDLSKRSVTSALRYGRALNFIKDTDDGHGLTENGFELAFATEDKEKETLFREAISNYRDYQAILYRLIQAAEKTNDDLYQLDQPTVLKQLRTTHGFTDTNEKTLKSAVNTLLKTLAIAGIGEYVAGRGRNTTRLELTQSEFNELSQLVLPQEDAQEGSEPDDISDKSESKSDNESDTIEEEAESGRPSTVSENDQEEPSPQTKRGPGLKISEVRIQNFRNIRDTGFFSLENVTTLIGKNESGKTSTLEAIASFDNDGDYDARDISREVVETDGKEKHPIVTLKFEIDETAAERFYPHLSDDIDNSITVTQTRYSDGSYDAQLEGVDSSSFDLPSPKILYYKDYDWIDDKATIDQLKEGKKSTFKNLLDIGELDLDVLEQDDIRLYNAIEKAENEIERKLNNAWSQKSLNIKLRWMPDERTIHLLIQDRLDPSAVEDERPLTYPSQRSEGFQWFLSFYINLLAESDSSEDETKILLLDDPAVYLHPEGKQDWLESINEIGKDEQVIFSSHSPYLIDKRYPSRIRAVEDIPSGGTKIKEDIFGANEHTLEPLRNALGIHLGSSPFVSRRMILVEGPTEYYLISAVANYFDEVLDRDLFGWQEVSIMPVRGATDVIGKATWLSSEEIDYAVLLDSDDEGKKVQRQISEHHSDINDDRVVLLENELKSENVVTEDLISPETYVQAFNEEYEEFTSELDEDFDPATVSDIDGVSWDIGGKVYEGNRLDSLLEDYLESLDVSEHLMNTNGEIELRKRQIAERIASRLNQTTVDENELSSFNHLFARIDSAIETDE